MRRSLTATLFAVVLVLSLAVAPMGAVAEPYDGERADLEIDQPDYIDTDVEVDRAENATIYEVRGSEQTISFGNANYSNVTDVGVLDGPGSIEPDDSSETFAFDPDGAEATTAIYFDVSEDGETTRYVADVRVSDVEWAHVPQSEYDEDQEALSTWDSLQRDAEGIMPGQDPVETIEDGLGYVKFFDSPFSSLVEDMQGTLIMLFWTPGGLVVGGSVLFTLVIVLAKHYRYKNRTQKQFAELEEMQREKAKAWKQKAQKILQQCSHNDLWPDHIARAMRDYFGRNVWLAKHEYTQLRTPISVKGTALQMMAQIGYVGRVEHDDAGNPIDARAVKRSGDGYEDIPVTDGGNVEEIDLADLDYENDTHRAIIDLIPADDLDEDVFQADIDVSEVSFPIDNREIEDGDLIDELNPDMPGDFEDREQLARVLSEMIQFVANHDHTDRDGNVRREKDLLSFLMEMDTVLNDEADFPAAYWMQKELLYVAEHMNKGDQLQDRLDAAELDGVSGSRIDVGAAGGD